jgi:mono/diheme cytochrome c family protein
MLSRSLAILLLLAPVAVAQNDSGPGDVPLLAWHFDKPNELGVKNATLDAGPRPPTYPGFSAANRAYDFAAQSVVTVRESDLPNANLRFGPKDAITLEAWVKVAELKDGAYAYVVGKGRNGKKGFAEKNQNYALRLKGEKGEARVSFLFASEGTKNKPGDWHRWTTTKGFTSNAWHHVAVCFTFGTAKSIRGYIDGEAVPGAWDMGGATDRAPVADGDDLTLGTGNGGGAANSFRGQVDDVTIWRTALPDAVLTSRYQFVPPPPVLNRADVPKGRVLVQLCEQGMPQRNVWPDVPPPATETYSEEAFGFFELPQKYVDTGVRGDRGFPTLLRAAAVMNVPAGKHRLLLRGRGASRLYIDNKLILTTPFPSGDGSGHGHVRTPDSYLNLGPDFRFAPPGNAETWAEFTSPGGEQFVILETIVGSFMNKNKRRPELGETVVAISHAGKQDWQLLAPARAVPYTDDGWAAYHAERSEWLAKRNAEAREAKRQEHAAYWQKRRDAARDWLAKAEAVPVPALPKGYPANNAIDHFLAAKIETAKADAATAKAGTVDFFQHVQPILEAKCVGCHTSAKAKGGLRLDDRASAFAGGKRDGPAVTPKNPVESAILARVKSQDEETVMPPKGERLTAGQIRTLETWVRAGANWPELKVDHTTVTGLSPDLVFLRRVFLDTVGVVPTLDEIVAFTADASPNKREKLIDKLLADPRAADHGMGYWQDVLAENPNILNPTLNNTGPFRWWLYESLLDNKPMDLFVTELLRMRGSSRFGGPAGFAVASQNDVPMAAKGTIVSTAFLGVEMKCARCHDAPAHRSTQEDLFQLAAMLDGKTIKLPATSTVPLDKVHGGGRKPLISITLKPGADIAPAWPFAAFVPENVGKELAEFPNETRDRLAALVTAPQNERFAQVIVNRIWKRLMGRGIVEPVDDWERAKPTHPELLKWLAREFVRDGYDVRKLSKLILASHAYQRAADESLKETPVLFTAPARRRLAAEQVVDSLFAATGKPMNLEEVSLDIDGSRDLGNSISLGNPRRSWMLTSTSNERDRPSLALPRIQAVTDVLAAFGWRGTRQDPTSVRELSPNVLQPAILQNGVLGTWLTRLSDDHGFTRLAIEAESPGKLVDAMFLRILTRPPTDAERKQYAAYLTPGFENRVRDMPPKVKAKRLPEPYVSWSNHLDPQSTLVRQAQEAAARAGDPPTTRLSADWRGRAEDVLWAVLNSSEFLFTP